MDIMSLLTGGQDPMAEQARQAAALRGQQQFANVAQGGTDAANSLNLLNFAAQNSNNPMLAQSVGALTAQTQKANAPIKLDKGIYSPATGDYAEDPGVSDEKAADRQRMLLQSAAAMQAKMEAAQQYAQSRSDAAQTAAQARVDAANIAAASRIGAQGVNRDLAQQRMDLQNQRLFSQTEGRMATGAAKANLPALIGSSTELVNRLQPYVDKGQGASIPGLTVKDRLAASLPLPLDWTQSGTGNEGATNAAMVKSAILDQLKTQVGLGGTNRARDEQLLETLSGRNAGSQDFIDAYNNAIHPRLEQQRKAMLGIAANFSDDDWQKHVDAGGIDYRQPIPKIITKGGGAPNNSTLPAAPSVMHFDNMGNLVR